MHKIFNLQRKFKVDRKVYAPFLAELDAAITEAGGKMAEIAFVSDARIREMNLSWRKKDSATDVLSFPYRRDPWEKEERLGDVVISLETAAAQAEENGLTLENEVKQLILHGVLHLCGYDHETDNGEMNSRELELRESLGI
jgi:probable rRNA maturation factor